MKFCSIEECSGIFKEHKTFCFKHKYLKILQKFNFIKNIRTFANMELSKNETKRKLNHWPQGSEEPHFKRKVFVPKKKKEPNL